MGRTTSRTAPPSATAVGTKGAKHKHKHKRANGSVKSKSNSDEPRSDGLPATMKIRTKSVESSRPLVVSFPGGVPAPGASLVWQGGASVVGWDEHCAYRSDAGAGSEDRGVARRRTRLCVGVLNKATGVLRVQEAACDGAVISLISSVPSYLQRKEKEKEKEEQMELAREQQEQEEGRKNSLALDQKLFEDFGSAKKRKVIKSKAANRVDLDFVLGAGAESALVQSVKRGDRMSQSNVEAMQASAREAAEAMVSKEGSAQSARKLSANEATKKAQGVARQLLLPKFNADADVARDVYPPQLMLGDEAWGCLMDEVAQCREESGVIQSADMRMEDDTPKKKKQEEDTSDASRLMAEAIFETDTNWNEHLRAPVLQIRPNTKLADIRYASAIMLNWMILFYNSFSNRRFVPPVDIARPRHFGIPVEYAVPMMERFTELTESRDDRVGHVVTKQLKDRMMAHMLILYLHVQGGPSLKVSTVEPIARAITRSVKDISSIYRLAGCTVTPASRGSSSVSVALKVPLVFPDMFRRVRR